MPKLYFQQLSNRRTNRVSRLRIPWTRIKEPVDQCRILDRFGWSGVPSKILQNKMHPKYMPRMK